jgi:dTDP-4-amino-4,6-dideoxygalactose transaminase
MTRVPFVDLKAQHRQLSSELHQAFTRVLENASFVLGPEVEGFEKAFASYLGSQQCIALNSGTAALHLTLLALGIGPGDEVITVPHTFIATAEAISAVGARPVFVDVDPLSYTMDPGQVEKAITPRTRAMIPVHLYGQPADLDALATIAARHGLAIIEDACQAHGAEYKGRKAGSLGKAGCFSFYPSKNLGGCGEGGAVVTDDPHLARQVRMLRDHGSTHKYEHQVPGYNYRMEGLQGAFLGVKLKYLDNWNDRRRAVAERYRQTLNSTPLILPTEMPYARHVYHLYVIQTDQRDVLREHLSSRGIETGLHYPLPLHLQEAYRHLGYSRGDFPVAERVAQQGMSLPMFGGMEPEAADLVGFAIREFFGIHAGRPLDDDLTVDAPPV